MRFTKMQGLGNDYVYVNCFDDQVKHPAELARRISDRHFGVGSDGLILVCPSDVADVRMRIFNADGSEAEMCGNGIRCLAKYAYERGLVRPAGGPPATGLDDFASLVRIETGRGILTVGLEISAADKVERVCVNMGRPVLAPAEIPVALPGERVVAQPIQIDGQELLMTCVSMGNPHAVFFCDDPYNVDLISIGPRIETHRLFPRRTNVHFVKVNGPADFTMRTWERGSGLTLACGTGACASCVAAALTDQCSRTCTAHLPGGDLELNWSAQDDCVYMTGPAVEVFEGVWPDA